MSKWQPRAQLLCAVVLGLVNDVLGIPRTSAMNADAMVINITSLSFYVRPKRESIYPWGYSAD